MKSGNRFLPMVSVVPMWICGFEVWYSIKLNEFELLMNASCGHRSVLPSPMISWLSDLQYAKMLLNNQCGQRVSYLGLLNTSFLDVQQSYKVQTHGYAMHCSGCRFHEHKFQLKFTFIICALRNRCNISLYFVWLNHPSVLMSFIITIHHRQLWISYSTSLRTFRTSITFLIRASKIVQIIHPFCKLLSNSLIFEKKKKTPKVNAFN